MNNVPVKKNEEYVVEILDNGFGGEGIAKIEGFTIFIPNAIKGEKCEILIVKVLTSHAYGKILKIIQASPERVEVDCSTYKRCGGCDLRHMTYDNTLELKKNAVQSLVNKSLKQKVEAEKTIGMENPFYYRNKAQYPLGLDKDGNPAFGIFAQRTHTIIPIDKCFIQTEISQEIAKTILEFIKENNIPVYNEENQTGLFRHIVVKVGKYTNEVMCILVINGKNFPKEEKLVELLCNKYKNIRTIVKNINDKNTNVILGKENINGKDEDVVFTFHPGEPVKPSEVETQEIPDGTRLSKEEAKKLGCNKVALAHHCDDLIETFFLSLIYEGRLSTFKPKTYLSNVDITAIRPLIFTSEKSIINSSKNLPIIKNICPANHKTKREEIKLFLQETEEKFPKFKEKTLKAIISSERYNLFDKN